MMEILRKKSSDNNCSAVVTSALATSPPTLSINCRNIPQLSMMLRRNSVRSCRSYTLTQLRVQRLTVKSATDDNDAAAGGLALGRPEASFRHIVHLVHRLHLRALARLGKSTQLCLHAQELQECNISTSFRDASSAAFQRRIWVITSVYYETE